MLHIASYLCGSIFGLFFSAPPRSRPASTTQSWPCLSRSQKQAIKSAKIAINKGIPTIQDYFSKVKFNATLRDYQQDMVDSCNNKTVGVLEAMTGAGKTVFSLALILKMQQPTIFLVNTVELADQTIKSFAKFSNLDYEDFGFIGNGKFEIKPITIALHQTMSRLEDNQFKKIGDICRGIFERKTAWKRSQEDIKVF